MRLRIGLSLSDIQQAAGRVSPRVENGPCRSRVAWLTEPRWLPWLPDHALRPSLLQAPPSTSLPLPIFSLVLLPASSSSLMVLPPTESPAAPLLKTLSRGTRSRSISQLFCSATGAVALLHFRVWLLSHDASTKRGGRGSLVRCPIMAPSALPKLALLHSPIQPRCPQSIHHHVYRKAEAESRALTPRMCSE